jgi:DNA-directed RNA polymerase sigma subunit (sigma70/sigma32)
VHVVERQQKLGRAARRLEVELGRDATREELAEATGLPVHMNDEAPLTRGSVEVGVETRKTTQPQRYRTSESLSANGQ